MRANLIPAVVACLAAPLSGAAQSDPLSPEAVSLLARSEVGRIGGMDERLDYVLTGVSGAAILTSGNIAVSDRLTREIRVYSPRGGFLRKMGREGNGPGEFRALRDLVALEGDRVLAWDPERRRVSVFAADGTLSDTWLPKVVEAGILFPEFVGSTPAGQVVLRSTAKTMFLKNEEPGMRRDPVVFAAFDKGGEMIGTPTEVVGPERLFYREGRNWGADRRGVRIAAVEHRSTRPVGRLAAGADILRELAELEVRHLEDLDAYETVPAFHSLLPGSDGSLWVSDHPDYATGSTSWVVWDANKRLRGRVLLTQGERLAAAGRDLLATVVVDDFGVETAVVYRLGTSDLARDRLRR